jgi:HEAT repeat protein
VDYLIDSFDKNENFRPTVVEALGRIGSPKALEFILNNYIYVDELTKFSMLESIGLIGDDQAFFLVLTDLKNISGPMTWAAIEALKKLRDKLKIDVPYDESMKNAILSTLVDAEPRFQKAAAGLISVYQDTEIVDAILKIFGTDPEIDDEIKVRFFENPSFFYPKIASYLKQKPANIKQLIEPIKEMIQNDGGESIFQMNELELRNLGDVFADNLTNTDEEVRRSVMELLFFVSIETAYLFLDTMSDDDNIWNRLRLLEILESLDDERIVSALIKLADDPEGMVAEKAREILNQKGVYNIENKV